MIVFDLHCTHGHRFEGWFGSSSDYEEQKARGLVTCPQCGTSEVDKAPMAPAVPAKGNSAPVAVPEPTVNQANAQTVAKNKPSPAQMTQALKKLAEAQEAALKESTWVGSSFAEQSREMHYGERDEAPIHGQASLEEAKSLVEEGVPVAPLPFPVIPPDERN